MPTMKCKNCKYYTPTTEYKAISVKEFSQGGLRSICWKNSEYNTENILPERSIVTLPVEWVESLPQYLESLDAIELPNRFSGECSFLNSSSNDINGNSDNVIIGASDDHGLFMEVGENFGCIHFQNNQP